jgi:hypothetical protein
MNTAPRDQQGEASDVLTTARVIGQSLSAAPVQTLNDVTTPAWPGHPAWMRKFLDVLGIEIEP